MCFKYDELMQRSQVPSNTDKSVISLNQYASNQSRVQNVNQQKTLPLKQLRDIIQDIYASKLKFDLKARELG